MNSLGGGAACCDGGCDGALGAGGRRKFSSGVPGGCGGAVTIPGGTVPVGAGCPPGSVMGVGDGIAGAPGSGIFGF